jgi:DNA-binding NtrC family response regulator
MTETAFKGRDMKRTILVVDDESGPRESLKVILKPFYHVEIAEDATSAFGIIDSKKVDLVTLDLKMPSLQGEEILKIIKRKNPEIEVIIVSGNASLKSAINGIRYGASDFIIKPFNISDLTHSISTALNKKKRKEELKDFLNEIGNTFGTNVSVTEVIEHIKELRVNQRKTAR